MKKLITLTAALAIFAAPAGGTTLRVFSAPADIRAHALSSEDFSMSPRMIAGDSLTPHQSIRKAAANAQTVDLMDLSFQPTEKPKSVSYEVDLSEIIGDIEVPEAPQVPAPAAIILMLTACAGLGAARRRASGRV